MKDWQPIEAAPKDGTIVDIWSEKYGERMTNYYREDLGKGNVFLHSGNFWEMLRARCDSLDATTRAAEMKLTRHDLPKKKPNLACHADRAQRNGIARRTFHERVRSGMHPDEACTVPVGALKSGVEMDPVYKAAVANGVPIISARVRRRLGWSDWEIVNVPAGVRIKTWRRWLTEADDASPENRVGLMFEHVEV